MRKSASVPCLVILATAFLLSGCELAAGAGTGSVRVVNTSMDYPTVDLYLDDKLKVEAVGYEDASGYVNVDVGTYDVEFRRNGASSSLDSFDEDIAGDDRFTWLILGASGDFQVMAIDETHDAPDKGKTLIRLANAASDAGVLDVYLTDESTNLADTSPSYADVSIDAMASEGLLSMDSGTYRLRVTAAGSTTDVRLDRSDVVLAGKAVYTLVVCGTTGGVLTDAMLLQQDGAATLLATTQARVRAVVGLDGASTANVSVGGTPLVAAATIPVLGTYRLVDAGAAVVSVTIDGSAVAVAGINLASGSDNTLVYTGTSAAVLQSLVVDVNRLPATGEFKLRLINSMSALNEPISMSVDYLPVAESVLLGSVALSDEIAAIDSGRLDVSRVTTSTILYSLTSISFASQGVYTQVMFGSSDAATGALRKDR